MPRCLRTDNDDSCDDLCVFVDDVRGGSVVCVNVLNIEPCTHRERVVDIISECPLLNRHVFSKPHAIFRTCRFDNKNVTFDRMVICYQSCRSNR